MGPMGPGPLGSLGSLGPFGPIWFQFQRILLCISYLQARLAELQQITLSNRLLKHYLHSPYVFHLTRNSANLIRNIVAEVGSFTSILTSFLDIFTNLLVIIGISIFLLFYDLQTAVIVISIFILAGLIFDTVLKRKLKKWGEKRLYHTEKMFKSLQEIFNF